MTAHGVMATAVVATVFVVLAATALPPYLVILGGVAALLLGGVISSAQALAGFSNPGLVTIALLFVVAAGLRETGVLTWLVQPLLGRPRSTRAAQGRLAVPVAAASAFLSNTALVTMFLPVVKDWARRVEIPPSKILIPLSYASVLGGMCTLIGTSTNLVVNGLLVGAGLRGLGMFEISVVAVPCAAAGLVYLILFGPRILPDRASGVAELENPREYTLEMVVEPGGPVAGKTVEGAGLRHLPGVYLAEIHRAGRVLPAIGPDEPLEDGDQLVFVGAVDSVMDLQQRPGLKPALHQLFKLDAPRANRWFVEAVVSHRCPIVGQTIRDGRFRTRYDAVVIGVARGGERIRKRIGDIVLRAGDVLLLEALPAFVERHRGAGANFYLVSRVAGSGRPPRHEKAPVALAILVGLVVVAAAGWLSLLEASLVAAALMIVTRCASEEATRRAADWQLLLAIAGAFGLAAGLTASGAAGALARGVVGTAGAHPWVALACIYAVTVALSELITNNAAAVIMFPIALATAHSLGVSYMPFVVSIMIAASAAFATPLGYQTHLMVYGPGGYRFRDFARAGLPLDILCGVVTVALAPLMWHF